MTYQETIEQKIAQWKDKKFPGVVLTGMHVDIPFTLEFLTRTCINDTNIIGVLSRWRKKHEVWFPAIFPVTPARTRQWYINGLMNDADRLLFLLRVGDSYIGHIGLNRFIYADHACEIDNIVRGKKGYPGIIEEAIRVMIEWGTITLGIRRYTLSTFSDNTKAVALYERLGFVHKKKEPLVWIPTNTGGSWEVWKQGEKAPMRYYTYMERIK